MLSQVAFTVAIGFTGSRLFFVIEDSFESSGVEICGAWFDALAADG
jgi:hypothetical protein